MVFASIVFLSVFLPVVFLVHLVVRPIRVRNLWLIAASLLFYSYGEPVYVLLMLVSSVFNWGGGPRHRCPSRQVAQVNQTIR